MTIGRFENEEESPVLGGLDFEAIIPSGVFRDGTDAVLALGLVLVALAAENDLAVPCFQPEIVDPKKGRMSYGSTSRTSVDGSVVMVKL